MNSITNIIMAVLLISSLLFIMIYLFPIAVVKGRSMYPTFIPEQFIVATRLVDRDNLSVGSVYIYKHDGKLVIKRLKLVVVGSYCFFVGDNPDESYDSRDYGLVNKKCIVAKVIMARNKTIKEGGNE